MLASSNSFSSECIRKYAALFALCLIVFTLLAGMLAPEALAQGAPPGPRHPPGTCTSDPQFDIPYAAITPGSGLISTIITDVKNVLASTTASLFVGIGINPEYRSIVTTVITLYIMIYGLMFTFGMVQASVYDFFIRMIKIGVIFWLIGGIGIGSLISIFNRIANFFNNGTDAIIAKVTQITVGGISAPYDPNTPFAILDSIIAHAVSAKMAVTILATFFTGPYGILFGILLLMSLGSFLKALFTAIWVYLMSLVLKTLLIGLGPIFIPMILFARTKPLFDGWLNQLVNASLQPIFLFIFFAFFASLIEASMLNILANPVCWTEWQDSVRGTPFAVHYWRFAIQDPPGSGIWEPYGGLWTWEGNKVEGNTRPFPIDIMHILIFLMLAELAGRFNNVVTMIASDIAAASTNLASMQGPGAEWFGGGQGRRGNLNLTADKKPTFADASQRLRDGGISGVQRDTLSVQTTSRNRPGG